MASADFFETPEIDVFDSEVEALVISVYKATIAGIEVLDKRERAKFRARHLDSDPEVQQESWWWDDQIRAMKYHAGNMSLVSLVLLFDHWRGNHRAQGPLPLAELEDMVTARNSIIHHRGESRFEYRGTVHTVSERFLRFDDALGREHVAVDETLLTDLARKLTSFVNLWTQKRRKRE
jgi:hypothetical protein